MKQFKDPLTGWWLPVPEPKEDSYLMGFIYFLILTAGIFTLFTPPLIVLHFTDALIHTGMAWMWVIGGIAGMITSRIGSHRWERPALYMALTGCVMLAYILVEASFQGPSVRAPQACMSLISCGVLVWRWWSIKDPNVDVMCERARLHLRRLFHKSSDH